MGLISRVSSRTYRDSNPPKNMGETITDPALAGEEISFWLKYLLRIVGTLGAIVATIIGLITLIEAVVSPIRILQGALCLFLATVMFLFEATIVCSGVTFMQRFMHLVGKIKHWHKAALYGGLCIVIVCVQFSISMLLWMLVPFASATLYGMVALGRKADRQDMMQAARGTSTPSNVNYENFD